MFKEHKKEFYDWYVAHPNNKQTLQDFFISLGYNIQDRFIIKHKDYRSHTVTWCTVSHSSCIDEYYYPTYFFNRKTSQWYINNIIVNKDTLIYNHLFYKHKTITGDIYNHIQTHTAGTSLHDYSDCIAIDIDNHSHNTNTLLTFTLCHTLLQALQLPILYIEKNIYNGGYHIFLRLPQPLSHTEKQQLVTQWLIDNNIYQYRGIIHVPHKLRFPFSTTYNPIIIHAYGDEEYCSPLHYVITRRILKTIIINNYPKHNIQQETLHKKEYIHSIYRKKHIQHISPQDFISHHPNYISKGNRHIPMLHIIRVGKYNGWALDDCIAVIKACHNTSYPSKDLSTWSERKLYSIVQKLYSTSTISFANHKTIIPDSFISNTQYIPDTILSLLNNDTFIIHIIKHCNYKVSQRNILIFKTIIKEMIGYCYFLINTKYKTVSKQQYSELLQGFQFSKTFCNKLKEYYNFTSVDVYYIVRCILKSNILFSQVTLHNHKSYYFSFHKHNNYCKIYSISSFNYNTTHNTTHNKEIFSYYILLQYYKFLLSLKLIINNYLLCCGFLYRNTIVLSSKQGKHLYIL